MSDEVSPWIEDFCVRLEKHGLAMIGMAKRHRGKNHIDGQPITREAQVKLATALNEAERCGNSVPPIVSLLREYASMLKAINAGLAENPNREEDEE